MSNTMNENTGSVNATNAPQDTPASNKPEAVYPPGSIEIIISEDNLKCWLLVTKTSTGAMPEKFAVLEAIEQKKIVAEFIDEEELNRVFDELVSDEKVLIAEGKPKKDGTDGYVKYHFKTDISEFLQENEKGQVDFKQINFIQHVKTGDVVAEIIPPEKGSDGITVTGKEVKAREGKPVQLPVGPNTELSKENPDRLIALVDGAVALKRKKVTVDPVVVIEQDVDYSTGNINYKGSVTIKGAVKAGFTINAGSDVFVNGVVEDAVIESGGNVVLKSGFIGKGTGRIKADGDVLLPFAENQYIIAGGNVIVADTLLHCIVESDGKVVVSGPKGVIGGSVAAFESIEAQTAGSQASTETSLIVGLTREMREKYEQLKKDMEVLKTNRANVSNAIAVLEKINLMKRGLPPHQEKLYSSLTATQKELKKEEKLLAKIKAEVDEAYEKVENAVITVHQRIYPGVKVEFGNVKKVVREHGIGVIFKMKDKEIAAFKKTK